MAGLHQRRVEQERRLLGMLVEANSEIVIPDSSLSSSDLLRFRLLKTAGLVRSSHGLRTKESHDVILRFPRFFPSLPMEASLQEPVFHPNIHPENGFVCLWGRFSPGDTVIEAVVQLQRVLTWQLVNEEADHMMQAEALAWYRRDGREISLPLPCEPVRKPAGYDLQRTFAQRPPGRRVRLS